MTTIEEQVERLNGLIDEYFINHHIGQYIDMMVEEDGKEVYQYEEEFINNPNEFVEEFIEQQLDNSWFKELRNYVKLEEISTELGVYMREYIENDEDEMGEYIVMCYMEHRLEFDMKDKFITMFREYFDDGLPYVLK
jgi:hypothetical protein